MLENPRAIPRKSQDQLPTSYVCMHTRPSNVDVTQDCQLKRGPRVWLPQIATLAPRHLQNSSCKLNRPVAAGRQGCAQRQFIILPVCPTSRATLLRWICQVQSLKLGDRQGNPGLCVSTGRRSLSATIMVGAEFTCQGPITAGKRC